MQLDLSAAAWLHPPASCEVTEQSVTLTTDPGTDFWQRTYYGFRNDNAPALLWESRDNFTLTARASFTYRNGTTSAGSSSIRTATTGSRHQPRPRMTRWPGWTAWSRTWATRLGHDRHPHADGHVVSPEPPRTGLPHRVVARRYGLPADAHLPPAPAGETTAEMGKLDPPAPPEQPVRFGLYACSPLQSSFQVRFDQLTLEPCRWHAHG